MSNPKIHNTMKTLRYTTYPPTGFGDKSGQIYIIDELGHIYDFASEYDNVLDERFWWIDLPIVGHITGKSPMEIIDEINANECSKHLPEHLHTMRILEW